MGKTIEMLTFFRALCLKNNLSENPTPLVKKEVHVSTIELEVRKALNVERAKTRLKLLLVKSEERCKMLEERCKLLEESLRIKS